MKLNLDINISIKNNGDINNTSYSTDGDVSIVEFLTALEIVKKDIVDKTKQKFEEFSEEDFRKLTFKDIKNEL